MKEKAVTKTENEILTMSQTEFVEVLDRIFSCFLSESRMLKLSQRDYEFARDLMDAHHLLVSPDIPKVKMNKAICNLLKCSWTKAKRIIDAHFLLWGDAKQQNLEFKKVIICNKILEFAEEAEKDGDSEKAVQYYEKYYTMMGLDKMEQIKTPRSFPKLVVLSSDPQLLEIEDAEIDE